MTLQNGQLVETTTLCREGSYSEHGNSRESVMLPVANAVEIDVQRLRFKIIRAPYLDVSDYAVTRDYFIQLR